MHFRYNNALDERKLQRPCVSIVLLILLQSPFAALSRDLLAFVSAV